ncbi:HipA N-terminal domain-containing protein [Agromyces aurantiacus]|uniref:HipA N-terminal domain-containing protein n=1 Tax=Agromyces aurantiacus TaxID=165814 RepID=A0ABV9R4M7_9MICO|nr:HipA N-terminal domain-containing protein [Agromyces aurantiacus]
MPELTVELYGHEVGRLVGADWRRFDFEASGSAIERFGLGSTQLSTSVPLVPFGNRSQVARRRNFFAELLPEGDLLADLAAQARLPEYDVLGCSPTTAATSPAHCRSTTRPRPASRARRSPVRSTTPASAACCRVPPHSPSATTAPPARPRSTACSRRSCSPASTTDGTGCMTASRRPTSSSPRSRGTRR